MKLSIKISLCMSLLNAFMILLTGINTWQMSNINQASMELSNLNIPCIIAADTINNATSEHRIAEARFFSARTDAQKIKLKSWMEEQSKIIDQNRAVLEKLLKSSTDQENYQAYTKARRAYLETGKQIIALGEQGKLQEAADLLDGTSEQVYLTLCDAINKLVNGLVKESDILSSNANATYLSSRTLSISLVCLAVLFAVGLTIFIVRNTLAQLGKDPGELVHIANRVTQGDYAIDDGSRKIGVYGNIVGMVTALKEHIENARLESERAKEESRKAQAAMLQAEEAGKEAQAKTKRILEAADRLEEVATIVSSASTELSAQIEQSDRGAAESADRLAQAATAMNEMNATVLEVAKNAGTASDLSASTRETAIEGARIVEQAVKSIQSVQQKSASLRDDMSKLSDQAHSISQIMGVISDIADQTNLLALNAAIEAARAGEAGRGFAVVADEVRKLAEKTMASTTDVGNAIRAIQESVNTSMSGVDETSQLVDEATTQANQSGKALHQIMEKMEGTADQVQAIATASEEQSAASEEINESIGEVNSTVGQTADAMRQAALAVSDLASQAQKLTVLIADMKRI